MSEIVTGYIDHVIFRNESNGYTVMVLKDTGEDEELTCVGSFPAVAVGATIEARGTFIHHSVYGKQFQIESFEEKMLVPYLSISIGIYSPGLFFSSAYKLYDHLQL